MKSWWKVIKLRKTKEKLEAKSKRIEKAKKKIWENLRRKYMNTVQICYNMEAKCKISRDNFFCKDVHHWSHHCLPISFLWLLSWQNLNCSDSLHGDNLGFFFSYSSSFVNQIAEIAIFHYDLFFSLEDLFYILLQSDLFSWCCFFHCFFRPRAFLLLGKIFKLGHCDQSLYSCVHLFLVLFLDQYPCCSCVIAAVGHICRLLPSSQRPDDNYEQENCTFFKVFFDLLSIFSLSASISAIRLRSAFSFSNCFSSSISSLVGCYVFNFKF